MPERVILLEHRGRLGNQLWNLAAVFAFCRHRGYPLIDRAANDYAAAFEVPAPRSVRAAAELADAMSRVRRHVSDRRVVRATELLGDVTRRVASRLGVPLSAPRIETNYEVFYLPPSEAGSPAHAAQLERAERAGGDLVLVGWLFKNPQGIIQHRDAFRRFLAPKPHVRASVDAALAPARLRPGPLVGLHIRKGDYRTWLGGRFFVDDRAARMALDELLERRGIAPDRSSLLICSDGSVDTSLFSGFQVLRGPGTPAGDLLALARCELLIASNSTFASFASYLGDVPLVLMRPEGIDWEHYEGRSGYFEDKYFMINHLPGAREGPGDGKLFAEPFAPAGNDPNR